MRSVKKTRDYEDLEQYARNAALNAYAPYSKFRVGAAVRTRSGRIIVGANIENASYGLTQCAERVALGAALASGERDIVALCVACIDAPDSADLEERVPCGACRQWIQELAPEADIIMTGEERVFKIRDLLPSPFKLAAGNDARVVDVR